MSRVAERQSAAEIAKNLSREHGPMALVRLDWKSVTSHRQTDVDQFEPDGDERRHAYAVIPCYALRKAKESSAPRSALVGTAIFDGEFAGNDRYDFVRGGEFFTIEEYALGKASPVDGYDPFADEVAS